MGHSSTHTTNKETSNNDFAGTRANRTMPAVPVLHKVEPEEKSLEMKSEQIKSLTIGDDVTQKKGDVVQSVGLVENKLEESQPMKKVNVNEPKVVNANEVGTIQRISLEDFQRVLGTTPPVLTGGKLGHDNSGYLAILYIGEVILHIHYGKEGTGLQRIQAANLRNNTDSDSVKKGLTLTNANHLEWITAAHKAGIQIAKEKKIRWDALRNWVGNGTSI